MKPEKVWRVGDRVFTDYADAVRATSAEKNKALLQDVTDCLGALNARFAFGSEPPTPYEQAVELLAHFDLKRKRRG